MGTHSTLRRNASALLAASALLVAAACGGGGSSGLSSGGSSGASSGSADKGAVTMSGQNFTEMKIMAEMYKQVLEHAGYTVDVNLVDTRDLYLPGLEKGRIDLVPEYVAGIADQLNGENQPFATHSPQQAVAQLEPLASKAGITMLEPSKATDQNAFFVTKDYATSNNLTTLSDLAALNQPVTLAAAPDCKGRDDCEGGLTKVYGMNIAKIVPTGYGTQQTKDSVTQGESQLGETGTTDASLDQLGLVLLKDDKGIQPAQNLIPAVNSEFLQQNPDVEALLNKLSETLTTDDLAALNAKVDVDRQQAADVAKEYLSGKGLI